MFGTPRQGVSSLDNFIHQWEWCDELRAKRTGFVKPKVCSLAINHHSHSKRPLGKPSGLAVFVGERRKTWLLFV